MEILSVMFFFTEKLVSERNVLGETSLTFCTGWAKGRYTVINYILYTYFWPIL